MSLKIEKGNSGMRRCLMLHADIRRGLKEIADNSVHCCVTSPPYWSVRDYETTGQLGQEDTIDEYLSTMVDIFEDVKRVMHKSGTLWVNMSNNYNSKMSRGSYGSQKYHGLTPHGVPRKTIKNLHPKNLVGQSWMLALALQEAGWILRADIIWQKPDCMPSSVTDRPVSSHEYMFLFAKSPSYYFNHEEIKEKSAKTDKLRNGRSVWSIVAEKFPGAHFATFPKDLVSPCIAAGSSLKGCCPMCFAPVEFKDDHWYTTCRHKYDVPEKCTILDPFMGSGTTAIVANSMNRHFIGIEINKEYVDMAAMRHFVESDCTLFTSQSVVSLTDEKEETKIQETVVPVAKNKKTNVAKNKELQLAGTGRGSSKISSKSKGKSSKGSV